jgi:uncharacterized surface protein with fasciclin (FAS1) repeats
MSTRTNILKTTPARIRVTKQMSLAFSICALLMSIVCIQCSDNLSQETFYKEDELQISAYLEEHKDEFSTLLDVLDITDLKPILNAYGHYTFFAPDNNAFNEFCSTAGFTSVAEFDKSYLTTLVKYHLLNREIESNYFPNGVLADTNYTGDNLVFSFLEGGLHSITVNNEANITEADIRVSNGFINKTNKVLSPVFLSLYDMLKAEPDYSIFTSALEATGLSDTLELIYVTETVNKYMKSRFTVFAEPNSVFQSDGINSFEDLKERYSDSGDLTNHSNGLNQFMAYHCVPGLYYLNQLDSFNYPTMAENKLISVTIRDDIYLNEHVTDTSEISISINRTNSNRSAKNGVIHSINQLMEVYDPQPKFFVFDFTSYQRINLGETYTAADLKDINGIKAENTGLWYRMSMLDEDSSYLETTSSKGMWNSRFPR